MATNTPSGVQARTFANSAANSGEFRKPAVMPAKIGPRRMRGMIAMVELRSLNRREEASAVPAVVIRREPTTQSKTAQIAQTTAARAAAG